MNGTPLRLKAALGTLEAAQPLVTGEVKIPGVELEHVEIKNHVDVWRRMSRTLEFDVSLMSVVSYLCAVEYGVGFKCLPVCLNAGFHHADFIYNKDSGITGPQDLKGRRVGTRNWTVTPGVWDRGILLDEFGVDWRSITWVLAEPEHVPEAQEHLPANVIAGTGEDLFFRLESGDIDAGIAGSNLNRRQAPNVVPLFPNAHDLDKAYYERTGILQPFIVVAVKTSVIDEHPGLMEALYRAFVDAKRVAKPAGDAKLQSILGDADPIPFGLEANRAGFEEIIRLAREFEIISGPMAVDDIFPALN